VLIGGSVALAVGGSVVPLLWPGVERSCSGMFSGSVALAVGGSVVPLLWPWVDRS
jgi:hypothetical protein